jgi:feruloyl esterase
MRYPLTTSLIVVGTLGAAAINGGLTVTASQSCENLNALKLPNATIRLAQAVDPGAFTPPVPAGAAPPTPAAAQAFRELPAFCRVTASLQPTRDSDITIEVWLPASGWNGKLQSLGNGGWAGVIPYPALGAGLAQGYATAATDTGHVGNDAAFVPGHPEKLVDYGYRAVHEMTVATKALIVALYGQGPKLSYWNGCSTGGRQGLMEAQRFQTDYDGIIAGAPVNDRTGQLIWELWIAQAVHQDEASYIPPAKYPFIHAAALEACDARDGLRDGLIDSPAQCHFDPNVLECKHGDAPSCLTASQTEAARKIYSPAIDPRTKREIFPALQPGSELGWASLAGPQATGEAVEFFKHVVFNDPAWDYRTLKLDTAVTAADKSAGEILNATNPNLRAFFNRGGKLLMYHGWTDQLVAPLNSVKYYTSVVDAMGGAETTANSMRLFMVPGMNHCRGGDGPNTFDSVSVLDQWVEKGRAPGQIIASHSIDGKVDRTRPLCPYPQIAEYKGTGSTDEAANFICRAR